MPYSFIGEVSEQLLRGNSGPVGWGFDMQGDYNDDVPPHRGLLDRFSAMNPQASLVLPAYEADEDYIEGAATWNGMPIEIYYETLLNYLSFWSTDRTSLASFRAALLKAVE